MPEYPPGWERETGGVYGFFADLIGQGLSQRAAIDEFRGAGGRAGNEFLRETFRFVRDDMAARPTGWAAPLDQSLSPEDFTRWDTKGPERFAYPIDLHVTFPDGEQGWMATMVTSDSMLTPVEALQQAIDQAEFGEDYFGDPYAVDVHGGMLRGSPYVMGGG